MGRSRGVAFARAQRQRQAARPGLAVRATSSPARTWRPAVGAHLVRTVKLWINPFLTLRRSIFRLRFRSRGDSFKANRIAQNFRAVYSLRVHSFAARPAAFYCASVGALHGPLRNSLTCSFAHTRGAPASRCCVPRRTASTVRPPWFGCAGRSSCPACCGADWRTPVLLRRSVCNVLNCCMCCQRRPRPDPFTSTSCF